MRFLRSKPTMLLIAALVLAATAGCARKSKEAPPAPAPAPPTTEQPPTPPAPPPTPEPTPPPPTPETVAMTDVFFDFDSFALRSDAQTAMDGNVKMLRDAATAKVTIEGHCDERGTVELHNLALGEKRANAAKDYLVTAGISASRIETVSYGKERPFDMGHDESAWAKNRRAHFVNK